MSRPIGHPPAGWYPDPGGEGARWWDGYGWTAHTAPVPGSVSGGAGGAGSAPPRTAGQGWHEAEPAQGPSEVGPRWRWDPTAGWQWVPEPSAPGPWATQLRPAVDAERRLGARVRWAVVVFAAATVAAAAARLGDASALGAYFHWVHIAWDAAQSHATAPAPPAMPTGYVAATYLSSLVELAAGIVFLVWQHRAASNARWLGLPARHTPGWGVGFWFVPIANLWCPYQALRDCLPAGHPAGRRLLGCWLLYLLSGAAAAGAFVATGFSVVAGTTLLVVLGVLWILVVVLGWRLVVAIGDCHRAIVGP